MFPGAFNLQGGGNIQIGTGIPSVQPSRVVNPQPAAPLPAPVYRAPAAAAPAPAQHATAAPVSHPAPPPVFFDSAGRAFSSQAAANASNIAMLTNSRNSAVGAITTGEGQAFNDAATAFTNGINPFLNNVRASQTGIDQSREDAELNRLSSVHDLLDTIRQGTQSFGIGLANRNASDSGAAEAGAKAYAREGEKGYSQIEGKHALDVRGIDTNQNNLNASRDETSRQLHQSVSDNITRISNDTQMQLEQLSADAAYAGLSPLDIAGLRARIISGGQNKLRSLDADFSSRAGGIAPESHEAASAKANQLFSAGAPAPGAYNFSIASPALTGAPISQISSLPVFLGRKDQSTV